jgi:formylglycine-generating enzyme required for sulfatase activity
LNRLGKLLLIFDGFDEMAARVERQKMINNFWELARVVVPGAKAILTCRSEHFPEARQGRALLNAELKASTDYLSGEPPQFEVLELEQFDDHQVRRALAFRTGEATVDFIMGHEQLRDLARRPVMMEYIVEALPDIEAGKPLDLSRIYLYAVGRKLDRDVKAQRTFTSLADKLFFMCELSFEMLTSEQMSLNYRAFPERLRRLFGPAVSEEKSLDHWHYDMMGNTLLIRSEDGDYSPAHRSLAEFFTAFKLTAQLGVLPPDFSHLAGQQSHVNDQLPARPYTWSAFFLREAADNGRIIPIAPLHHFTAEDADGVLTVLAGLGDNVLRFVHEITHTESVWQPFHRRLKEYLEDFKAGRRDPAAQQEILTLLLKFRRLSRSWEEAAGEQEWLRRFWQAHREQEVQAVRSHTPVETIHLKLPGKSPIDIDMVQIPAGSFLMGDDTDQPVHRVHLTKPFLLAPVPVTQALYRAVTGENPSDFKGDDRPVETVSWLDAAAFCNRLSEKMGLQPVYEIDGDEVNWNRQSNGFRLPTEAEWEYACRAGTTTVFAHGDLESGLDKMAWYEANSEDKTHPVGLKAANAWGLHDMHGNVWEWVWDWYGGYPPGPVNGPTGPDRGSGRVGRGGSWYYVARLCRSAVRRNVVPGDRHNFLGVRLSRSLP